MRRERSGFEFVSKRDREWIKTHVVREHVGLGLLLKDAYRLAC